MKNYTNWLLIALLFLCQKSTAQGYISLKDRAKQIEAEQKYEVPQNTQQVNNSILSDTFQNAEYVPFQNLAKKKESESTVKNYIADVFNEWDKLFEEEKKKREKVKENAFNIFVDTVFERPKPKLIAKGIIARADTFDFNRNKITVKYDPVTKQFIGIKEEGVKAAETFGIVEDEPDTIFFVTNSFSYKGETYERFNEKTHTKRIKSKVASKHIKIESNEQFIDLYEDAAMDGERYGVPYSITMAQAILESRGGRSKMAVALNNLFGIKCNGGRCNIDGCPHGYFTDDRENETFRAYKSFEASFKDHVNFFLNNDIYQKCLSCGVNNIECWLYRLQKSGYATDRMYDYKLADIINRYDLTNEPIIYNRNKIANHLKNNQK